MAETALNFGPDWLRALAHGSSNASTQPAPSVPPSIPKYSLAKYRYGREEMLALMPKDPKKPDCLKKDTSKVVKDNFVLPLALTPATEDETRLWSRSVNSDAVLRASGKSVPGNSISRSGRGGSVDRGRGRGRGGYYQRGIAYEDSEDGPPTSFSRPKPIERSQSANEKDQRWDDRDRRFDRNFSGRGNSLDDNSPSKSEHSRNEYWRKFEKDEEHDWRSSNLRPEKHGSKGSWRNPVDKERKDPDRNSSSHNSISNPRNSHSHQKFSGNNLPEWSVEESNEQDVVGTFDSSGAFLETKVSNNSTVDDIYVSDDADEGMPKDIPEAKQNNSKKPLKKSSSLSQMNSSVKQNVVQTEKKNKSEEIHRISNNSSKISELHSNNNFQTDVMASQPAEHVIKINTGKHEPVHSKNSQYIPVTLPNVPDIIVKSTNTETVMLNHAKNTETSVPSTAVEEDAFAHHEKATENMVAQWTKEEEQKESESAAAAYEKEDKWFYQDPQNEIQGPFTSPEMLEWFSAGYFTMSLMVRRSCDEKFSQLGELIKSWGRVPFMPGKSMPPIRVTPIPPSLPTSQTQTIVPNPVAATAAGQLPKQDEPLLVLQQQLLQQQLMQQQLMLRQAQLQQLLEQLKQQDNFASLSAQQQQQVLLQQFMAQQHISKSNQSNLPEQTAVADTVTPLPLPLLGLPVAPFLKNDLSFWSMPQTSNPWPLNLNAPQPIPTTSVWDIEQSKTNSEAELEKQKLLAEQEKFRQTEEQRRLEHEKELEEKRKLEELKKKEEERRLKELQEQEEEKRRIEKLRKEMEQKLLEEQKQKEQLRKLEELRKIEEQRQLEELKKQEEQRQLEIKRKEEQRQLELRKKEEQRQLELRKKEEQKRLEELQKQELKRLEEKRKEEEREKQLEMKREQEKLELERQKEIEEQLQREKQRQKDEAEKKRLTELKLKSQKKIELEREQERVELEKQKEISGLKEIEFEEQVQQKDAQKQKEENEKKHLAEIKLKTQGPVWGIQNSQSDSQLSLADIQRIQEEKERKEKEEKERIRQQLQQQQALKQAQQNKNGLGWAKKLVETQPVVKSLAEIQQEEAERLAQQKCQKTPAVASAISSNSGVWSNASHLNKIASSSASWNVNNVSSSGFWDEAVINTQGKKQQTKANDSAFPALTNPDKPATVVHSNRNKNVRAKKEEDVVTKLFKNRKPTDEFTAWCTEALSALPSSVDVPTFVAFLKDIESPYEVHDYVKSYLGDGKEPREFAKQFLDRRSKFRAKQQAPSEENTLWGPAPAITPVVNKPNPQPVNENDGNSNTKGKTKKRKNRMQKLDSSMLGFTVQPNPDRLNVGEIDHVDGM